MMAERDEHFGLTPAVIEMVRRVFSRYPSVTEVRVYGSRAKGDYKAGSDIDLSIMDEDVSSAQLMQIETEFDELPTLYSIDLSLFHHIDNPALTEHILRVGKVFYRASATA
jgi:predicted nucleotidyltransferase